jgi:hypothetical protein
MFTASTFVGTANSFHINSIRQRFKVGKMTSCGLNGPGFHSRLVLDIFFLFSIWEK